MKVIDFLIYYLTYWFEKKNKNLVWSTPLQRAIYAVVLAMAGMYVIFEITLENMWFKREINTPKILIGIVAIGLNLLLRFIYIKKGRYEKIKLKKNKLNKTAGVVISIFVVFFCIVGWLICYMIIIPPGKG